jgi:hypothetical protein
MNTPASRTGLFFHAVRLSLASSKPRRIAVRHDAHNARRRPQAQTGGRRHAAAACAPTKPTTTAKREPPHRRTEPQTLIAPRIHPALPQCTSREQQGREGSNASNRATASGAEQGQHARDPARARRRRLCDTHQRPPATTRGVTPLARATEFLLMERGSIQGEVGP